LINDFGCEIYATKGTYEILTSMGLEVNLSEKFLAGQNSSISLIANKKIDLVLNTTSGEEHINEEAKLRLACLRQDIPCITSLFAMTKLIKAIASKADKEKIIVRSLQQIGDNND